MSHTVFITGASRGLGLELARQFLDAGSCVFAAARVPESNTLQSLKSVHGDQLQLLALDVTDGEQISKTVASLAGQPLHLLINNAGLFLDNPFVGDPGTDCLSTVESNRWLTVFRVNTIAPFMMTRALRANLKAADPGTVVMISAMMGSLTNNQSGGAYSYRSSKAALNAVTVSLATDLAADGTRVVALHPGWLQTEMGGHDAPVDTPTSAKGLRAVMLNIDAKQNGGFFDHTGRPIPW
tara:strand:- start:3 stop:719 length:717 start_codon:yes stop_codon:yes gene_type:complete